MSVPLSLKVVVGFNRLEIELSRKQSGPVQLTVVPPQRHAPPVSVATSPDRTLRSALTNPVGLALRVVAVSGLVALRLIEQASVFALRTPQPADDEGDGVDISRSAAVDDTSSVVRSLHSHQRSQRGVGVGKSPRSGDHAT
ncbi:hypothetical protein [Williamsia sp.]|uniref:hypothetical protein n=1 Tax=Williamsia sp. TaxID=1872085 RepID=UPI001A2C15CF|nr:hypothetical protein [Williamsia sp.]MBJ7289937.1 hypothetical protein [Williamsia sp.]